MAFIIVPGCADDDETNDDSDTGSPTSSTTGPPGGTSSSGGTGSDGSGSSSAGSSEEEIAEDQDLRDGPTIVGLEVMGTAGEPVRVIATQHPVVVDLWLQPAAGSTAVHDHEYHIGLVQSHIPGADRANLHTCQLGVIRGAHAPDSVDEQGRFHLRSEFVVPDDCLSDDPNARVFNLWVATNPALEGVHDDQGGVHDDDYNTQFFTAELLDTDGKDRNRQCIGPDNQPGCIIELTVAPSPGRDVHFRGLAVDNPVFSVYSDCGLAAGHPDIETSLDLRMYGQASFTGQAEGEMPVNILGETLEVSYALCPRDATTGNCVSGETYETIGVLGHPDGAVMPEGAVAGSSPLNTLYNATPQIEHHDLHIEHNQELCRNLMNLEDATRDWSTFNHFNLRACVSKPTTHNEAGLCDLNGTCTPGHHDEENNCQAIPMRLLRVLHQEHEHGLIRGRAATKSYAYSWDKSGGGSVVGASAKLWTETVFSLDGATTSNGAQFNLTGWASAEIFKAWFDAQAYVSLVGSGYDTGLRVFGKTLWSSSKTQAEIAFEDDKSISKQVCYTYNYGIAGIGLNASLCATGSVGIDVNATVKAVEGAGVAPFDAATRIGEAQATVTPKSSFGLSATASVNVVVARGGITGTLTLIHVSLPITGTAHWGLISGPRLVLTNNLNVKLNTTFLSGSLNVWVDLIKPKWCSCGSWCPGYPCTSWASVVNKTLVSFSAYKLNRTVYDKPVLDPIYIP